MKKVRKNEEEMKEGKLRNVKNSHDNDINSKQIRLMYINLILTDFCTSLHYPKTNRKTNLKNSL